MFRKFQEISTLSQGYPSMNLVFGAANQHLDGSTSRNCDVILEVIVSSTNGLRCEQ